MYGIIFVVILMPVVVTALLLLTKTSVLSQPEILINTERYLPYPGSIIITLVCSVPGLLYRLLPKRYHT